MHMDPDTGRLECLRRLVRAQIHRGPDPEDDPVLLVDDRKLTWRELGQMLVGLEGGTCGSRSSNSTESYSWTLSRPSA